MLASFRTLRLGTAALALAIAVSAGGSASSARAQTPASPSAMSTLPTSTVSALQEALTKQGFPVKVDGVLGQDTRDALKTFQAQHHLEATGEPDRATLGKLGVPSNGSAQAPTARPRMGMRGKAASPGGPMHGGAMHGGMLQGDMAHCETMHREMQSMMTMMQDMMKTMHGMQGQSPAQPKQN